MSTRSHHQLLLGLNPLAVSIYSKAIVWYEMDDIIGSPPPDLVDLHGGGAYDLSINSSYSGTTQQLATLRSGGTFSTAFTVSANGFVISPPDFINDISGAVDHSVVAWYKPRASNPTGFIISQSGGGGFGFNNATNAQWSYYLNAGVPTSEWQFGALGAAQDTSSTLHVVSGTTYFLGYTKNTIAKTVDHYTNGALQNTAAYVTEPTGGTQQITAVGQLGYFTTLGATGGTQSIAAFLGALTAAEHNYLYNAGIGRSWAQVKAAAGH